MRALPGHRCDAEIADRVAMRSLPKGRLAWKGCRAKASHTVSGWHGLVLHYCTKHAIDRGHLAPAPEVTP